MPNVVTVSSIANVDALKTTIETNFEKGRYMEITHAIGMYSLLIDSEHTITDQNRLYRSVLDLQKDRVRRNLGKAYATWYADFPEIMTKLIASGKVVTDAAGAVVVTNRYKALGPFRSVDDFFFWALDDRRLPLDQIITYIDKTVGSGSAKAA